MATAKALLRFLIVAVCTWTISASSQAAMEDCGSTFCKEAHTMQPDHARAMEFNDREDVWVYTEEEALEAFWNAQDNQIIHLELDAVFLLDTIVLSVSNFAIEGMTRGTLIECPPEGSAFTIEGSDVDLTNLNITHCKNGSAIVVETLTNESEAQCPRHFATRRNSESGPKHSVNIVQCKFLENSHVLNAAAIAVKDTKLLVKHCEFRDNVAKIGSVLTARDSVVTIQLSSFIHLDATARCGGVIGAVGSELSVERSDFRNSRAYTGGAISTHNCEVKISDSLFWNTSAIDVGGVVSLDKESHLAVHDCHFFNASAGSGGAIHAQKGSTAVVTSSVFENNQAANFGGSFCITGDSKLVLNTSVLANGTASSGGAIAMVDSGRLLVEYSTIYNNSASIGESLYASCEEEGKDCTVELIGSDFVGVSAEQVGGALYLVDVELDVMNCVFRKEKASSFAQT